ncbi:hypothetical protein GEV33_005037 [Tenebrio molitor]|uniref:Uncharacterized protein n=1 Tax=Tenebrio molitor TaxID=7067 RepID=A0A8J6HN91_TENMO|nr:hypothetical protein GEV33_005037 [Tenebrio molitor]
MWKKQLCTSLQEGNGQWLSLEAELVMRDGEVVGTKNPTGHSLLVDCRFELPFGRCDPPTGWRSILRGSTVCRNDAAKPYASIDPENIEASDLQRKLEMLNNIMDQEARLEQARRQMQYFGHFSLRPHKTFIGSVMPRVLLLNKYLLSALFVEILFYGEGFIITTRKELAL